MEQSTGLRNQVSWVRIPPGGPLQIAKLCEYERLELPVELPEWFRLALGYPGVAILELTPDIAMESAGLPGRFHRDPADQIIVATARVHQASLVTSDRKLVRYPHVWTVA